MNPESSKPRMQRFYRYNAPLHAKQHFVHSHVDKELKKRLGISVRSIRVAEGDTVKIMSGSKRGSTGKVSGVNLSRGRITVSGVKRKNAKGKEMFVSISPSNVYITELNLTDTFRAERLKLQVQPKPAKAVDAAPKEEPKQTEKEAEKISEKEE